MKETHNTIIQATRDFVYNQLKDESSGHDWWHIVRVTNNALTIGKEEKANLFICEMAALLHDIADDKLNPSEEEGLGKVEQWLKNQSVSDLDSRAILEIIEHMSFKGGSNDKTSLTLEGQIVQDADRLDAIGAIGIARVMTYSGYTGRPIHDPDLKPRERMTIEEYRNGKSSAIMHFYEKLLQLKQRMNTKTAKELAEGRHAFLETYLEEFYAEWDGLR